MEIKIFEKEVPEDAKRIRIEVFINEQGFDDEFDPKDSVSTHFVMYDENGTAVATSRVFQLEEPDSYCIGRIAVIASMRGKKLGSHIVGAAEEYIRSCGGKLAIIHAQSRAAGFYSAIGYTQFGDADEEEGCPHVWMKKAL